MSCKNAKNHPKTITKTTTTTATTTVNVSKTFEASIL